MESEFQVGTVKMLAFSTIGRNNRRVWGIRIAQSGMTFDPSLGSGVFFKSSTRKEMIQDIERAYAATMKHGNKQANENRWRESFGLAPLPACESVLESA